MLLAFSCAYIELWCTWEVWRALKKLDTRLSPRQVLDVLRIFRALQTSRVYAR